MSRVNGGQGGTGRKRTTSWANTKSKIHLTREPNTAAAAAERVADEGGAAAGEGQEKKKKQQHLS